MKKQDYDHRTCAIGVQAAEKRSSGDCLGYVSNCCVRMIGGRNIVQREENSGDHLRDENKEQPGTKYIGKTRATGNRFIQSASQQIIHAGAAVQPSPYS